MANKQKDQPAQESESLEQTDSPQPPETPEANQDQPAIPPESDDLLTPDQPIAEESATPPGDSGNKADPPNKPPLWKRLMGPPKRYVLLLVLLLIGAGIVIYSLVGSGSSGSGGPQQSQSLTDTQIAELKGSTTLVGDAQQLLDVQSNSVFEGQVLVRKNLEVAGTVQVGGSLDLPAITVGGRSSLGQLEVSKNLTVAGTTTLQGLTVRQDVTIAGSASVSGNLSAGKLSVNTLQLNGDLAVNRHITVSGGVPGRTNGSALGGGGTVSVNGGDTAGTVTINTGSSPGSGCFVTVRFARAFNSTPHVVISPANSSAASLQYYVTRSASGFSVCTASSAASSRTYVFDYVALD